jgi:CDP-paratose 2-epimerase
MSIVVITGSAGLVGSEAARLFHAQGLDVVGIDNDLRAVFFGAEASVAWNAERLAATLPRYRHHALDIRDERGVQALFAALGPRVECVVHAAAQPSHDWAAREPATDFAINAVGTQVLLEATRRHCPQAAFLFTSSNKVYGDTPNRLPLLERETRWELDAAHPYAAHGIDEAMSVDGSLHTLFGAGKLAADVLVQEYAHSFGLKTVVFRGGCLTGSAHAGAEAHGFLAYLVRCALTGRPYTIHGYKGKQVRDNLHAADLASAFWHCFQHPRPGAVYNVGGARFSNCSILEAIELIAELGGKRVNCTLSPTPRPGDHIWWISDVRRLRQDYPQWSCRYDLRRIVEEIIGGVRARL